MGPNAMASASQGMGGLGILLAVVAAAATAITAASSGNRGPARRTPDPTSSSTVDNDDQRNSRGYKDNDSREENEDFDGYESSESNEGNQDNNFQYRIRSLYSHILDRFSRYIRLGGAIQRISERTFIPRSLIIRGGASRFQDQSSNRGRVVHAAHVVRAGEINERLGNDQRYRRGISSPLYNELRNFLGHTQNVPRYANEWNGIGGNIDRIQSGNLDALAHIDFSGMLTQEGYNILMNIKEKFVNALLYQMQRDPVNADEYNAAYTVLMNVDIEELFNKEGKGGYTGHLMKKYRKQYKK